MQRFPGQHEYLFQGWEKKAWNNLGERRSGFYFLLPKMQAPPHPVTHIIKISKLRAHKKNLIKIRAVITKSIKYDIRKIYKTWVTHTLNLYKIQYTRRKKRRTKSITMLCRFRHDQLFATLWIVKRRTKSISYVQKKKKKSLAFLTKFRIKKFYSVESET